VVVRAPRSMSDDDALPISADLTKEGYYRGTVLKVARNAGRGTIRSASGRNIPFIFQHVTMVGPRQRFEDLHEGQEVGFDVSWTSKGLRISIIRIPD
jgi:cold shock CspA family protein